MSEESKKTEKQSINSNRYSPHVAGSANGKTFDVGVVIALSEEFHHFIRYVQEYDCNAKPRMFWVDDHCFWSFEVKGKEGTIGRVKVVAYLVGEMGTEFTAVATNILVEKWHVPFIVNIGLTGSFDKKDLKVGSILIPTMITHYSALGKIVDKDDEDKKEGKKQENSKLNGPTQVETLNSTMAPNPDPALTAVQTSKNSDDIQVKLEKPKKLRNEVEFLLGTRAFATNRLVVSQFANFLVTLDYHNWQKKCMDKVKFPERTPEEKAMSAEEFSPSPTIVLGHLASGNHVVDSERYKRLLKSTDRKLMGCEMEAAGFMIAEQFLQSSAKVASQFIALRCISDFAANKETAEEEKKDKPLPLVDNKPMQNREYAMRNATFLLLFMIEQGVIHADVSAQVDLLQKIVKELNLRKGEAKKRGSSSDSWTVDQHLDEIKQNNTQITFKNLDPTIKRDIILKLSAGKKVKNMSDTALTTEGIQLLKQHKFLVESKKPKAKRDVHPETEDSNRDDTEIEEENRSVDNEGTEKNFFGDENRKRGSDAPPPTTESSNKRFKTHHPSQLPVGELRPLADQLLSIISQHSDRHVDSERLDKIKNDIESAIEELKKLIV
jgi:nucleoside phosphorylase